MAGAGDRCEADDAARCSQQLKQKGIRVNHDEIRKTHFERLNGYRNSQEYADYATRIGAEAPQGDLPSLIGNRWEIDEETYMEFLEMLPPLGWKGGTFYMSEFSFDDITAKYSKDGDRYFCEFARYPEKKAVRTPPVETPWGPSQHITEIAPGIVSYSTASHGGIHLSDERIAEMPEPLRAFVPFGGPQRGQGMWLEEDCDWSVAALAFPQFFKPDEVKAAHSTLKGYRPEVYAEFVAAQAEPKQSRFMSKWLDIGKKNEWICEAYDPPFNTKSFHQCKDDAELIDKFKHGNWSLGQAFHIGDLCFIQQVDGGDEWLTIKEDQAFESISFGRIIERGGREAAQEIIDRIRKAKIEKCRSLDY